MKPLLYLISAYCLVYSTITLATVSKSDAISFTAEHKVVTEQSKHAVFQQIINISQWWHSDHTFSGDQKNLYIDYQQQRCFCEQLIQGGFVEHLRLIHYQPSKKLIFSGGLGPLQSLAIQGKLSILLKSNPNNKNTEITFTYRVQGTEHDQLQQWAKPVDQVLAHQIATLEQFLTK